MKAVSMVLQSLLHLLKGRSVKWFTDNQNVVNIIKKGSMKQHLQEFALQIFKLTLNSAVRLDIEWVPRTENEQADFLSKMMDVDDWGVTTEFFEKMELLFGPHTIDKFANFYNK